jgi:hypothetical protein
MKKRIFAILAVVTLVISFAGASVSAAGHDQGGIRTLELPSVH